MWPKNFKDYPKDTPLKKEKIEPGKGIIGCEMHEQMGWGELHDRKTIPKQPGFFRTLLYRWLGGPKP